MNTNLINLKDLHILFNKQMDLYKKDGKNIEFSNFLNALSQDKRTGAKVLMDRFKKIEKKNEEEANRVKKMYDLDRSFNVVHLAGADEVGRGPLAGPIVAAAVILESNLSPKNDFILGLKDSKKLSPKLREELSEIIKNKAISYHIALINNTEIDRYGIQRCNVEVLKRAILGLKPTPDYAISDGYAVKGLNITTSNIIKGDMYSASIAAASIVAKVYRDNLMLEYSKIYPEYNFESNMGYGTKEHIAALTLYGPTPIHRKSFIKNFVSDKK